MGEWQFVNIWGQKSAWIFSQRGAIRENSRITEGSHLSGWEERSNPALMIPNYKNWMIICYTVSTPSKWWLTLTVLQRWLVVLNQSINLVTDFSATNTCSSQSDERKPTRAWDDVTIVTSMRASTTSMIEVAMAKTAEQLKPNSHTAPQLHNCTAPQLHSSTTTLQHCYNEFSNDDVV